MREFVTSGATKTAAWTLLALAAMSACSTGAGDGRIWGSLYLPECDLRTDDYDMEIDFFAASAFENTLTIRLQRTGKDQAFSDGVLIVVRDVAAVSESIETDGQYQDEIRLDPSLDTFIENGPSVGVPLTTWDSPASVTLYLNATCPDNVLSFTDGTGEILFESLYMKDKEKRILGSFDLRFLDPRYWQSNEDGKFGPHAHLQGEFDFNYTRGSPAQTFP